MTEEVDPWEESIKRLYAEDPAFCEEYFNREEVEGPLYGPEVIFDEEAMAAIRREGKIPDWVREKYELKA